jgi:hypothetical protein
MRINLCKVLSIDWLSIKGIQIDDENIDLEVTIQENNTKILTFIAGNLLFLTTIIVLKHMQWEL